jgi:glyoxylase-like metal-dependent hydrolase (beta-lactamase superfamily II)
VARRAGRTVFGVVAATGDADDLSRVGGRSLAFEPPDDAAQLAYVVSRGGDVRWGPAGRPRRPAAGAALVHDADAIAPAERAAARDHALLTGRTVFVCDAAEAHDVPEAPGRALRFAPPADGSLCFAARPDGTVLVGDAALLERAARVADPGHAARLGAALRQLRRLRDRAEELATRPVVTPADWSRVERLVPETQRRTLRGARLIGQRGSAVAAAVDEAVERELERLRRDVGRLVAD